MKSQREILAENLERLIDSRGIDQKILAEKIGVSDMTISNWVRGLKYPRIDKLQSLAEYFGVKHSDLVTEKIVNAVKEEPYTYRFYRENKYDYYPFPVSAGLPSAIDCVTTSNVESISVPDSIMGKWAGHEDIYMMRVNGDSMNKVFPTGSMIAVKKVEIDSLKNDDIVVFSDEHEYSVKRFYNDEKNQRIIFSPDSKDRSFLDYSVSYEDAKNLIIHGKVVVYIVELD